MAKGRKQVVVVKELEWWQAVYTMMTWKGGKTSSRIEEIRVRMINGDWNTHIFCSLESLAFKSAHVLAKKLKKTSSNLAIWSAVQNKLFSEGDGDREISSTCGYCWQRKFTNSWSFAKDTSRYTLCIENIFTLTKSSTDLCKIEIKSEESWS